MGIFSSSTTQPQQDEMRKKSSRQHCWDARDQYFACLEKHNIDNDITDSKSAQKNCKPEDDFFQQQCISSWVKYFREKRISDIKKNRRIQELEGEGAIKVEFGSQFK
jgi:cytochrome c oxidase assembly factor 6